MARKKKTEDEVVEPTKIKPKDALAKFVKKQQKDNSEIVQIGFASDMDLDYGFMIPPIPTLAQLLGRDDGTPGGFPKGKFTVVAGPERSGKSTLLLQTMASEMRKDPDAVYVWVDTEHSLDVRYAQKLGVDMDRVLLIQNGNMEDILNRIIEMKSVAEYISGIFIDSVGGLVPHEELMDKKGNEVGLEKDQMLNLQRRLPKFFRIINATIGRHDIPVVLISHVYQDVGGYGGYVVKGGNGLKHWGHVRLMISRANDHATKKTLTMPDGQRKEVFTGHDVIIKLEKTRQNSKEGHSVVVPYRYGIGLDAVESTISVAMNLGIIERSGAWYSYGEERVQGRQGIIDLMDRSPDMYDSLLHDITVYHELQKDKAEVAAPESNGELDESIA